ncbi:hypothetical protein FIBSPDRAFT_865980 [Athelia psychrophila]|uniref:Uncharacterized protein n=1 Tax=Athelia psychrophila TaxID=1759441 RepID=A0A166F601_9AGAM|nr:hypothetical protein FIBSPDRAFT_865980 [Fibularhizoctonia sp. CBS 109695]
MTVRLATAADHQLRPTQMDHTTIKFGTHMIGATPGSTLPQATPVRPIRAVHTGESQDDVWEGEGKYGVPLEEMFPGQGRGLVGKKGGGGSVGMFDESHNV